MYSDTLPTTTTLSVGKRSHTRATVENSGSSTVNTLGTAAIHTQLQSNSGSSTENTHTGKGCNTHTIAKFGSSSTVNTHTRWQSLQYVHSCKVRYTCFTSQKKYILYCKQWKRANNLLTLLRLNNKLLKY